MNNKFPIKKYNNLKLYFQDYFEDFNKSKEKIDTNNLKKIIKIVAFNYKKKKNFCLWKRGISCHCKPL